VYVLEMVGFNNNSLAEWGKTLGLSDVRASTSMFTSMASQSMQEAVTAYFGDAGPGNLLRQQYGDPVVLTIKMAVKDNGTMDTTRLRVIFTKQVDVCLIKEALTVPSANNIRLTLVPFAVLEACDAKVQGLGFQLKTYSSTWKHGELGGVQQPIYDMMLGGEKGRSDLGRRFADNILSANTAPKRMELTSGAHLNEKDLTEVLERHFSAVLPGVMGSFLEESVRESDRAQKKYAKLATKLEEMEKRENENVKAREKEMRKIQKQMSTMADLLKEAGKEVVFDAIGGGEGEDSMEEEDAEGKEDDGAGMDVDAAADSGAGNSHK
jgi:hypothetical protein